MPWGLERWHGGYDLHFITFSCYHRQALLWNACPTNSFPALMLRPGLETRETRGTRRSVLRLLPLFQFHADRKRLAVAQDFHLHHLADLAAAESVREVVQIMNRLVVELHHDVAGLQPSLGSGRPGANVGE